MKRILLILLISCQLGWAQRFDGVGLSMAGSYSALSRGINALGWNPANLAMPRGNTIEINLFSIHASVQNNSFSLNSYNRFFTEEGNDNYWSESDKKDLLNTISDNGMQMRMDVNANIFGLAFNNFGLAVQAVSQGKIGLSEDKTPFEILLYGEELTRDYAYAQTSQFDGSAYSAVKVGIGYAYPFNVEKLLPGFSTLSVGVSLNYFIGMAVAEVLRSDVLLKRYRGEDESLKYRAALEARIASPENGIPSGKGRGFDFGLATRYDDRWDFSLSFINIAAKINWSVNTERAWLYTSDSLLVEDLFDNNREDTSISEDTTETIDAFSTPLPAWMRMGAAYQLQDNWLVTAEYRQGLNTAFGNSTTPRLAVGTEYSYWRWLPIRAGMAVGGRQGFQFGLGAGLRFRFMDLDYSYGMMKALWPSYSKGIFNALSLKIKI